MNDFDITQYGRGYFQTTEGNFDGSVLAVDEDGVWVIPYDESDPIFVNFDSITLYADKVFGGLEPDSGVYQLLEDDYN